MGICNQCTTGQGEVTDGQVVRRGVSVSWNILSWSGGHELESRSVRTLGAYNFCPKSYLNHKNILNWCDNLLLHDIRTSMLPVCLQRAKLCYSLTSSILPEQGVPLHKKATIHQVTTMLATSENVLFPGHNHLLTTGTDDTSLAGTQLIIKVLGHQHQWLVGGYNLERGHF